MKRAAGRGRGNEKRGRSGEGVVDGNAAKVSKQGLETRSKAANAGLQPPQQPMVASVVPAPTASIVPIRRKPLDVSILMAFSESDSSTPYLLEDFFDTTMRSGDEDVARGLITMSHGMEHYIGICKAVSNDVVTARSRAENLFREKGEIERMWAEVCAENAQLKVVLDLSLNVHHRTETR